MTDLVSTKNTYGQTLIELGIENDDVFIVEADLMKASGSEPFKDMFPERYINVGIAEQNLVGVASGLAAMGEVPFASTFANFVSQRACDQVVISVAYNKFNVKLIGSYAGLSSEKNGGTHISVMDMAIMRCIPNMVVLAPGDIQELSQSIKAAYFHKGPVYIRMSRSLPDSILPTTNNFKIGKVYQYGDGTDLTIASTGLCTHIALQAQTELKNKGINARVLHVPSLKPTDRKQIIKCARETGAIVTVEDHSIFGGLGGLISEIVTKTSPVPVTNIGLDDTFGLTANLEFQLKYFNITVENISYNAEEILKMKCNIINIGGKEKNEQFY